MKKKIIFEIRKPPAIPVVSEKRGTASFSCSFLDFLLRVAVCGCFPSKCKSSEAWEQSKQGGVGGKNIWSFDEASFFRLLLLSSCDTREDTLVSIRASPPTRGSDGRICICSARWNLQDFLFLSPNQNHNLLRASFPNRNSTSRKIHVAESESGDGFTSLSA